VWAHLPQIAVIEQSVFVEFVFDVGERELGPPYRYVELRQHPGKRADVVLVSVRQDNSAYSLPILKQIGNIGHDDIHAIQFMPNSPSPPSGTTCSFPDAIWKH